MWALRSAERWRPRGERSDLLLAVRSLHEGREVRGELREALRVMGWVVRALAIASVVLMAVLVAVFRPSGLREWEDGRWS